ncbi:unnamed protein product [Amoebophrya sp. A25]|nr:unnamed protein product [Amoebophrya sp. A25]|eukprot:GSA25T00024322001.1
MGKKESSTQIDAWRRKNKAKERQKIRDTRKENFQNKLKDDGFDAAEQEIERLRILKDAEKLSHEGKHKLEMHEKFVALHAPELLKRQKEKEEEAEDAKLKEVLDRRKRIARFSLYYDEDENPYGIAPPGDQEQFRWPDGSVKSEPPFQDDDRETKRRKLDKETFKLPGFSSGMMAKIRRDALKAAEEEEREANGGARIAAPDSDDDDHVDDLHKDGTRKANTRVSTGGDQAQQEAPVFYVPPLPEEPYPYYEAPTMSQEPIVTSIELIRDTMIAIANVRNALLESVANRVVDPVQAHMERTLVGGGPRGFAPPPPWKGKDGDHHGKKGLKGGKDGKKGRYGKKGEDVPLPAALSKASAVKAQAQERGDDEDDIVITIKSTNSGTSSVLPPHQPPPSTSSPTTGRPQRQGPRGSPSGAKMLVDPKANAMLLNRFAKRGKQNLAYLKAQTQVSAQATVTRSAADRDMDDLLHQIDE